MAGDLSSEVFWLRAGIRAGLRPALIPASVTFGESDSENITFGSDISNLFRTD
jgi:hypothetical protein